MQKPAYNKMWSNFGIILLKVCVKTFYILSSSVHNNIKRIRESGDVLERGASTALRLNPNTQSL